MEIIKMIIIETIKIIINVWSILSTLSNLKSILKFIFFIITEERNEKEKNFLTHNSKSFVKEILLWIKKIIKKIDEWINKHL